ncbi:MAG: hypothetical protein KDD40_04945, partial [Bdellovibrionales bacterium]|nr:hypothetical protein [Bdellovibrionales bacterium]
MKGWVVYLFFSSLFTHIFAETKVEVHKTFYKLTAQSKDLQDLVERLPVQTSFKELLKNTLTAHQWQHAKIPSVRVFASSVIIGERLNAVEINFAEVTSGIIKVNNKSIKVSKHKKPEDYFNEIKRSINKKMAWQFFDLIASKAHALAPAVVIVPVAAAYFLGVDYYNCTAKEFNHNSMLCLKDEADYLIDFLKQDFTSDSGSYLQLTCRNNKIQALEGKTKEGKK